MPVVLAEGVFFSDDGVEVVEAFTEAGTDLVWRLADLFSTNGVF